jgi:uncharacterized membrane protein SpoIIM required for sporulation
VTDPLPVFVERRQGGWQELTELLDGSKGSVRRLDAARVRRLGVLYRQAVADLAYARRAYPRDLVTQRLDALVRRARPLVYGTVRERGSMVHFVTTGYWQLVRARPRLLALAALAMFGPALALGVWSNGHPEAAGRVAQVSPLTSRLANGEIRNPDTQKVTNPKVNASLSAEIFTNNVRVALMAFALGLTGGIGTVLSLVFNGVIVGLAGGLATHAGQGTAMLRLLAPHGVLELSLITVSGAAGLRFGFALINPGHRTRTEAISDEVGPSVLMALGSALLLVPCGLVEGFVTPRGLTLPYALAVGLGIGAAYWGAVIWRGRPDEVTAGPPT